VSALTFDSFKDYLDYIKLQCAVPKVAPAPALDNDWREHKAPS